MSERYIREYREKLRTADEAVKIVRSGDWIEYGEYVMYARDLDAALARRKAELTDVKIRSLCTTIVPEVVKADPTRRHFLYNDWHFSGFSRAIHGNNLCNYIPMTYSEGPALVDKYTHIDAAFILAGPMDSKGYFNLGTSNSITYSVIEKAARVIIEVNTSIPKCFGACRESVHISDVDIVVESRDNPPLLSLPIPAITDVDQEIASIITQEAEDGICLHLGTGSIPSAAGMALAESGLKDIGVHTDMLMDAYVDMYDSGRITGKNKQIDYGKIVYTFAMGSKKLYDFLHNNPSCLSYPANYTNDPGIIARNNKVFAVNSAIEADLFSQIASESNGYRHVSGTGGQLDFVQGAFRSKGGKSFICLPSTRTDRDGSVVSRLRPTLSPGTIVTVPRSLVNNIATEYGVACMKGLATWQRAEAIINIAHPAFRDELVREADKMRIWTRSNKLSG